MKWLPDWLKPWWAGPAPGAERGVKVYDAAGLDVGGDWLPYLDIYSINPRRPVQYEWIDIRSRDDPTVTTLRHADMHPLMNVANLYWRPSKFTGAGKEIEAVVTRQIDA